MCETPDTSTPEKKKLKWFDTANAIIFVLLIIEFHVAIVIQIIYEGFEWINYVLIPIILFTDCVIVWAFLNKSPNTESEPKTEPEPEAHRIGLKTLIYLNTMNALLFIILENPRLCRGTGSI